MDHVIQYKLLKLIQKFKLDAKMHTSTRIGNAADKELPQGRYCTYTLGRTIVSSNNTSAALLLTGRLSFLSIGLQI
jgi:hypothetical protein